MFIRVKVVVNVSVNLAPLTSATELCIYIVEAASTNRMVLLGKVTGFCSLTMRIIRT